MLPMQMGTINDTRVNRRSLFCTSIAADDILSQSHTIADQSSADAEPMV
jgi:hypothetical protein